MGRDNELVQLYSKMKITPDQDHRNRLVQRLHQYDQLVAQAKDIFEDRNHKYGDAITETGVLGAVVAMAGDYGRLKKMVIRSADHGRTQREEVRDKLLDNVNQCLIALMMLDEDNWEGE